MQYFAGTDQERASDLLIAAAEALLAGQNPAIPKDFVSSLFGRAAPEDLIRYDGRELAALAQAAWDFLSVRQPEVPKVRIVAPHRLLSTRAP